MSWQKRLRLGLGVFLVVFVAIVVAALRHRRHAPVQDATAVRRAAGTITEIHDGVAYSHLNKDGKVVVSIESETQLTYPDGRTVLQHVALTLPDRDGRTFHVTAKEGELHPEPDKGK